MNINYPFNESGEPNTTNRHPNLLGSTVTTLSGLDLRAIIGIVARQWRLILAVILLVFALTLGLLSQLQYRYTAEALLSIDERESQLVGLEDAIGAGVTLNNRVDTEVEILGSSSVALGAIDQLALWRDDEFGFSSLSRLDKLKAIIGYKAPEITTPTASRVSELPADLQAQLVDKLAKAVKITRRGLTSVISIKSTSLEPDKSALIANTMAESYLDVQIDAKALTAQRAANFLSGRVDELAKKIQDVDARIENFIVAQSDVIGTAEARSELSRMRDEIKSLAASQASFSLELAQLHGIETNPASASPTSVSAELRALAESRAALVQLTAATAPPDLEAQLQAVDTKLRSAASLRTATIRDELSKSDKQKEDIRKQLQELFGRQEIPSEVAVNLYRLQRDAESSRKLYDSYSTRLGEVQQQVSLALPNSRIVAPAIVPHDPSFPPSRLILAIAGVLGLGLGSAAGITREHLVGGFATPEQLEAVTGLPVLASIPSYREINPHDVIVEFPFSGFAESIRRLRIGIENNPDVAKSTLVVVTSTEPNEGKTTLAISLARALAISGQKTLLIDGDLRHPSVAKFCHTQSKTDLINLLLEIKRSSKLPPEIMIVEPSGLNLLTTRAQQNQASDTLIGSAEFKNLVSVARNSFEYVIIDCPPIGYVVDAKMASRSADLILYVVKQNATRQQNAVAGLKQMQGANGTPPIAIVLNNVRHVMGGYYYRDNKYNRYYEPEV